MNIADILRIKTTVSMAELKRNPKKIIGKADDLPMAILNSKNLRLIFCQPRHMKWYLILLMMPH
jgi:hypothetical protein